MNNEPVDVNELLAKAAVIESRLGTKSLLGGVGLSQIPHQIQAWKRRPLRTLEYKIRKFDSCQEYLGFNNDVKHNRRKLNNASLHNKVAYKRAYRDMEITNFTEGDCSQMIMKSMLHLRDKATPL